MAGCLCKDTMEWLTDSRPQCCNLEIDTKHGYITGTQCNTIMDTSIAISAHEVCSLAE